MATRIWLGAAVNRPHIVTIPINGGDAGWATGDTVTLSINGKAMTLTVGSIATVAQILADLVDMVNGESANGTETRSALGSNIGEWAEIVADGAVAATLRLTGRSDGRNFTVTASEVTAGAGTVGPPVVSQTGNGAGFVDEPTNWSGGAVPADGDTVVFDHRAALSGPKYNLNQNAVTPAEILVFEGFRHTIGLPDVNRDSPALPYDEFQELYLRYGNAADATNIAVTIDCSTVSRVRLDNGTSQVTGNVTDTGARASDTPYTPALTWKGTHVSNVWTISKGDVGLAYAEGESANAATLRVGIVQNQSDTTVVCGGGCTLAVVVHNGGVLETSSAMTTVTMNGGVFSHLEGAITTLRCDAGTFYQRATDTITTLIVGSDGIFDTRQDTRTRTVSNAEVHKDSSIRDPHGTVTWTNGIDFYRCTPRELTHFEVAPHQTWTNSPI